MTKKAANKKLSEVFLEFIEPVLREFGNPIPRTIQHDAACTLGHVVWNACILNELHPEKDYLRAAKTQGGNVAEVNTWIDRLAQRKRELFLNDRRLLGVYDVKKKKDGSFSLWTEILEPGRVN